MACDSWQVEQTGPSRPAVMAVPCALSLKSLSTPLWQLPQVAGMLVWWVVAAGSSLAWISCLPWQLEHEGELPTSPALSSARACLLLS